jgi:hypothetical protein
MANLDEIYQPQIERLLHQIEELKQSPVLDSEGEVRIYADLI